MKTYMWFIGGLQKVDSCYGEFSAFWLEFLLRIYGKYGMINFKFKVT